MSFSRSKDTMTNVVTLPVARVKEIISAEPRRQEGRSAVGGATTTGEVRRTDLSLGGGQHHHASTATAPNARAATDAAATGQRNARTGTTVPAAEAPQKRPPFRNPARTKNRNPLPTGVNAAKNATAVNGIIETDKAKAANRAEKGITVRANRATHATATGTGRATDRAPRKTNSAPNAGTPPANRTVNAATVRALAANSAGNVVRSVLVPKTVRDKNGSETDPTPTHSQCPAKRDKNGGRTPSSGTAEDATVGKATVGQGGNGEHSTTRNRRKRAITTRNVPAEYHSDRRNARYELPFAASDGRTPIPGAAPWSESAEIEIPNADTVTPRDLYIVVRYNDSFRDDTLRLTIRTISPDSLVFEESYTLGLPPRRHPAALAEEASVPYRRHVIFPDSGIYRMAFTPAMPVRGVEAIGINQQKSE